MGLTPPSKETLPKAGEGAGGSKPSELGKYTDQYRAVWNQNTIGVEYEEKIQCGLTILWTRAGW